MRSAGKVWTCEAGDENYIVQARSDLEDARKIMGLPLPKVAARTAYYAMFHAAEALIFEQTGKVAKTHSGVRTEFARLLKDRSSPELGLPKILSRAYSFKAIGDYGFGPNALVSCEQADTVLSEAVLFIDTISLLLKSPTEKSIS